MLLSIFKGKATAGVSILVLAVWIGSVLYAYNFGGSVEGNRVRIEKNEELAEQKAYTDKVIASYEKAMREAQLHNKRILEEQLKIAEKNRVTYKIEISKTKAEVFKIKEKASEELEEARRLLDETNDVCANTDMPVEFE